MLAYRADIDGLRAIAVLSVVLFHAFANKVAGGFVGVDIFFIISGYLISSIILRDLETNQFSLKIFYVKRIKRIFPSLVLVLSFCLVVGWKVLLPHEFTILGKHIAAGTAFVANIALWKEAGYFDLSSELKPLLHLWSLAIEEQFYMVWPMLLMICWKKKKLIPYVLGAVFLASFAHSLTELKRSPVGAFYSPLSRFWELVMGAMLAYYHLNSVRPNSSSKVTVIKTVQSLIGFALIFYAIFSFSAATKFPGFNAFLPTIGTLLIIDAGMFSVLNSRVLSFRPLVFIGLISYPLYLWHWPLLSFARIMDEAEPTLSVKIVLLSLSFFLSIVTYYFFEKPLRFKPRFEKRSPFVLSTALLLVGLLGAFSFYKEGFPSRYSSPPIVMMNMYLPNSKECLDTFVDFPNSFCMISKVSEPRLALLGDSHAGALFSGFLNFSHLGLGEPVFMGAGSCQPTLGYNDNPRCDIPLKEALKRISKSKAIETVLLTSYYQPLQFFEANKFKRIKEGYEKTFNILLGAGKKVVVILDVPTLPVNPASCLVGRPRYLTRKVPSEQTCFITSKAYDHQRAHYLKFMSELQSEYPTIVFFDPGPLFFKEDRYGAIKDGKLLYGDFNHLSPSGSDFVSLNVINFLKNRI